MTVIDSDDSDAPDVELSDASTDSAPSDPVTSDRAYKITFRRVCTEIFGEQVFAKAKRGAGRDHKMFIRNVEKIQSKSPDLDPTAIHVHVVCNQFARAVGGLDAACWEENDKLKPYYESGKLRRYSAAAAQVPLAVAPPAVAPPPVAPPAAAQQPRTTAAPPAIRSRADMLSELDEISDSGEFEEQANEPEVLLVRDVLEKLKIEKLKNVARKAETVVFHMWKKDGRPAPRESMLEASDFAVYEYEDTEEVREFITNGVLSTLLKLAQVAQKKGSVLLLDETHVPPGSKRARQRSPSPPRAVRAPLAPIDTNANGGYGGYGGYGANESNGGGGDLSFLNSGGGGGAEDQIYWGKILEDEGVDSLLSSRPNYTEVLQKVKMHCGGEFIKRYREEVERDPVTRRVVYRSAQAPKMVQIVREIKAKLEQNQ